MSRPELEFCNSTSTTAMICHFPLYYITQSQHIRVQYSTVQPDWLSWGSTEVAWLPGWATPLTWLIIPWGGGFIIILLSQQTWTTFEWSSLPGMRSVGQYWQRQNYNFPIFVFWYLKHVFFLAGPTQREGTNIWGWPRLARLRWGGRERITQGLCSTRICQVSNNIQTKPPNWNENKSMIWVRS